MSSIIHFLPSSRPIQCQHFDHKTPYFQQEWQREWQRPLLVQGLVPTHTMIVLAKILGFPWVPGPLSPFSCGEWGCSDVPNMQEISAIVVHEFSQTSDPLMALGLLCSRLKEAKTERIILMTPYVPYGRNPKAVDVLGHILESFGIECLITLDPHLPKFMSTASFDTCIVSGMPIFLSALKNAAISRVISPDSGGKDRATAWATHMGCPWSCLSKKRTPQGTEIWHHSPDWFDETCLIVDDVVDTGGTLSQACAYVLSKGARRVMAAVTHGVFSNPCLDHLQTSGLETLWISDSIPQSLPSDQGILRILPWMDVFSIS
jgi:ribose-phosphate pyrophosphokinase